MSLIFKLLRLGALVCLSSMLLLASNNKVTTKTMSPMAAAILIDSYRYMGSLEHFAFAAITGSDDVYEDTMLISSVHKIKVSVQRPSKLKVEVSGDIKNRTNYLSDGIFSMMDHKLNLYAEIKIPTKIDAALDYLFENFNIKSPLANLLYTDLDKRIAPKSKGYYLGTTDIGGKSCHHLGFVGKTKEFQVWVEKGDSPLIRRFTIIDKSSVFQPRSSTVLRWDTNPVFEKGYFTFKADDSAMKIYVSPSALKGVK
ncbi:MAG: hypothetical protein DRQ78_11700 [Epsilonproteobacteria bacterium]|nr:MAG: hypothetical protein DRQ78_11700 [Campylobacterota bacterium]